MNDLSYQVLKNALDASSMRQNAISSNIANVNTTGYKAENVEFESELQKALGENGVTMVSTNEKHLGGSAAYVSPQTVTDNSTSMNENGNNVDIDKQMVDLSANEIYYSGLVDQLNIKLSSMSYVINK